MKHGGTRGRVGGGGDNRYRRGGGYAKRGDEIGA